MSRELKFRAWLPDEGVMIPVTRLTMIDGWVGCGNEERSGGIDKHNTAIIMQYTGLKDKNNKEIYEGDIVEDEDRLSFVVKHEILTIDAFEVMGWNVWGFKDDVNSQDMARTQREHVVVGNIYENPELVKE